MDYISINDENNTSQHAIIKPKQFLKWIDTIVACRTGAIFSHFSGAVGEERVHGSRRASFYSPEKKKRENITPVLQANLIANLQSEKNALQPGKKLLV